MGFLSSLFGFGDKPTQSSTVVAPQLPKEMKPYVEEVLRDTQALYKQRMDEGYRPYTGETIAPLTQEQIAAQEGLKSLIGTQAPIQEEALGLARGATRKFTPEEYMSPYMRAVIDSQKDEAQRQYERTKVPEFEAAAVRAGGMSGLGTRAGVEAAERATGQNRLLADIEARGQQQAYEDAINLFRDQTTREQKGATQLSAAAPAIFGSGVKEQGLLSTIGEEKRDLAQSTLDEAYLKHIEEQQFPETQLARYQTSIYGNPLLRQPSYAKNVTGTGGGPQLGKTLLGLGTTAMGWGTGKDTTIGGTIFNKLIGKGAGGGQIGGLASMPQARPYLRYTHRNMGGQVVPPVVYRQMGRKVAPPARFGIQPYIEAEKRAKEAERMGAIQGAALEAKRIAEKAHPPRFPDQYDPESVPFIDEENKDDVPFWTTKMIENMTSIPRAGISALPAGNKVEAAAVRQAEEEASIVPTSAEEARKVAEKAFPEGQYDPESGRDPKATDIAKLASQQELEAKVDALKQSKDLNATNVIRQAFKNYDAKVRPLLDRKPYEKQKFWATIGAAIMQPGNAFANMAKGFKQAIDGLDADADTKLKMEAAILGEELKSEMKVAELASKSEIETVKAIRAIDLAMAKADVTTRRDMRKQRDALVRSLKGKQFTHILGQTPKEIKNNLEEYVKSMKIDRVRIKSLLEKIGDMDNRKLKQLTETAASMPNIYPATDTILKAVVESIAR